MKKFTILLLSVIFVTLITGSVQSISADDLEPRQDFSEDEETINFSKDSKWVSFSSTKDSKYLIHLQAIVRNAQGQLISVTETSDGKYLVRELTDTVFDKLADKKEIVIIDNMKYQKIHLTQITDVQDWILEGILHDDMHTAWYINFNFVQDEWHIAFATATSNLSLEEDDVVTVHWTILRELN